MTVLTDPEPRFTTQPVRPEPVEGLPAGWDRVPLEDVATIVRGVTYKKEQAIGEMREGFTPLLRATNITGSSITFDDLVFVPSQCVSEGQRLIHGDVVIASSSGSKEIVGKAGQLLGQHWLGSFGAFCTGIRPASLASPEFLGYYFQSPHYRCVVSALSAGSSINNLKSSELSAHFVPVAPRAEQTRIVEKLEELLSDLDAGVAELKAAQKKLTQYRQSLLKAAVEGALTAEWRARGNAVRTEPVEVPVASVHGSTSSPRTGTAETHDDESGAQLLERILKERRARWQAKQLAKFKEQGKAPPKDWQDKYPEPVKPDTTDLPPLPEGWVWSSIGQCFYVGVGATPSRKEPSYWNGDVPWVSSGEVRFDRIVDTKEKISKEGLNNSSTQINPVGSVMLGMIGEGKTRGQVAILDIAASNNQNCAAIWVTETGIPSEYVYYWLWSRYDETRRGSSGNNQPALNKSIVESIPFPLPPLDEAKEIVASMVAAFEQASEQDAAIQHALKQSTAQRKNILKAAFSGQLVPQDPNDEPASALLARIRAERAGLAWAKTVKKRVPAPVVDNFGLSHLNPEIA